MTNASHARRLKREELSILGLLRAGNPKRLPIWKRTKYEFLLEYGWWYEPSRLPNGISFGRGNECFNNAFLMALGDDSLVYCEGLALGRVGGPPVLHAWCTDGTGRAIDNTWAEPAAAYAGVPFKTDFLNLYHLQNRAVICMLDDWQHDWPMLRELGDEPETWLEPNGRGLARLTSADL